jgi:hypothetical protein
MNTENIDTLLASLSKHHVLDIVQISKEFKQFRDGDVAIFEAISLGLVITEFPRPDSNGISRGFVLTKDGRIAFEAYDKVEQYITQKVRLEKESLNLAITNLTIARKTLKNMNISLFIGLSGGIAGLLALLLALLQLSQIISPSPLGNLKPSPHEQVNQVSIDKDSVTIGEFDKKGSVFLIDTLISKK